MRSDSKYILDFAMSIAVMFCGIISVYLGFYEPDAAMSASGFGLFVISLMMFLEGLGKRIRDDILMELKPHADIPDNSDLLTMPEKIKRQ